MRYILGSDSLTAYVQGKPYTVNRTAEIFNMALDAIRADSEEEFLKVVNIKQTIVDMFSDAEDVVISGNRILYGEREITGLLARRVFEMLDNKLDVKPLLNFISNLMKNPSKRAVDETFGFVDACKLPITEDGCILAYKRIRSDYKDCHSGTIDNSVGQVVAMDRNMVDEDKDRTCSYGLHFCSYEYLKHFYGERIVVLKINPADIVAIPSDYNNSKGRCAKYEVVDEIALKDYSCSNSLPVKEIDYSYVIELDKATKEGTKMTSRTAAEFRRDLANMSLRQAAKKYGISRRQAARIRDNEAWAV
jgi:hypothetical protein